MRLENDMSNDQKDNAEEMESQNTEATEGASSQSEINEKKIEEKVEMNANADEVNEDVNLGVYDDDLHPDVIERRKIKKSGYTLMTGWEWFVFGWQHFKRSPIIFVLGAVVWVGVEVGFAFIPYAGEIIDGLLFPFLYAGFLYAARELDVNGKIPVTAFFRGFANAPRAMTLLMMGVPLVVFEVVEFLVLETLGPLIALLMAAPFLVMVLCGLLFAVPLIIFEDYKALDAIKRSFQIAGKNISPLITVFLMMLVFSIVGVISFGVAFAVVIPVTFCAMYKSHEDFFIKANETEA